MAKKVIAAPEIEEPSYPPSAPHKTHLFVICDDGSAYQFSRWSDRPATWVLESRWDGADKKQHRGQLPRSVRAHMEGRTYRSGRNWVTG